MYKIKIIFFKLNDDDIYSVLQIFIYFFNIFMSYGEINSWKKIIIKFLSNVGYLPRDFQDLMFHHIGSVAFTIHMLIRSNMFTNICKLQPIKLKILCNSQDVLMRKLDQFNWSNLEKKQRSKHILHMPWPALNLRPLAP